MLSLPFPDDPDDRANELPPQAKRLAPRLDALAGRGVFLGTSSWKYPGWLGSIYSPERYLTRGKFSKKKFEAECLAEYVKTFPTVCGDFAFYQFPSESYWRALFETVPDGFLVGLKVPEDVTVAKWSGQARYGERAGTENRHFLDPVLFASHFARRLEPHGTKVGPLIFEFGTFARSVFSTTDHFLHRLDSFLGALPSGFRYAVEIRNSEYLGPGYFACLSSHGVAHVFNAWTRMPELRRQVAMPGAAETADFCVARALLAKHRSFSQAVKAFEPYNSVKEPNLPARDALAQLAGTSLLRKKPAFLFVGNRLEGNSPGTIEAILDSLMD